MMRVRGGAASECVCIVRELWQIQSVRDGAVSEWVVGEEVVNTDESVRDWCCK